MKAFLLSAGLGTRLRPMTNYIPKCLVPIGGKPLLQIWLEKLAQLGVSEVRLNTHHLADQVTRFLQLSNYASTVTAVYEPVLLGTMGTIRKNHDFFRDTDTLLIHADNYCSDDLSELIRAHSARPEQCSLTLLTFDSDEPSSVGMLELDSNGIVCNVHHKKENPKGTKANAAIYLFSPSVIDDVMDDMESHDFSADFLAKYAKRAFSCHTDSPFFDVGTFQGYLRAAGRSLESG